MISKELVSQCSTPYEVVVLMELLHWESIAKANGKETYTTSNGYIAKTMHISHDSVQRAKESLKEKGLIDYTVNVKDDKTKETIYKVLQREEKTVKTHNKCFENKNKKGIINNKSEAEKGNRWEPSNTQIKEKGW